MIIRIFTASPLFLVIVFSFFGCNQKSSNQAFSSELGIENTRDSTTRSGSRAAKEYKAPLTNVNVKGGFAVLCRGFIARDGSIGPWGKEFIAAMHDVEKTYGGKDIFFGKGANMIKFGARCKSTEYVASLTQSQQEHIWAWTWASIAQAESSCRTWIKVKGIKNTRRGRYNDADGLLQLEYRTETRNDANRDKRFCPNHTAARPVNSQAIRFQARCGASIMARKHSGKFLYTEGASTTYWDKLRRGDGKIFKLLKLHPLCK